MACIKIGQSAVGPYESSTCVPYTRLVQSCPHDCPVRGGITRGVSGDGDTLPERHAAADGFGLGLGVGVGPGGLGVELAVHQQREVGGLAFPGTHALVVAEGEE